MSEASTTIEAMSEAQRDELLGRLLRDAFSRRGFGSFKIRLNESAAAMIIPHIEPAPVTTVPDMPAEYIEEIKRRAQTPEKALDWRVFREKLAQDLGASARD